MGVGTVVNLGDDFLDGGIFDKQVANFMAAGDAGDQIRRGDAMRIEPERNPPGISRQEIDIGIVKRSVFVNQVDDQATLSGDPIS